MKVLVTDNAHLYRTPDGKYYTPSIYSYDFFKRYLRVFEEVRFLAKTKHVNSIDTTKYILVSGDGLEIFELPWYQGTKEMFKVMFKLIPRYRNACKECDCYIYRVAQIESYLTYLLGRKAGKPYAVEVVNDPKSFTDVNGIFKLINVIMLKTIVKKANGAAYVTKYILQELYPSKAKLEGESDRYFQGYYSSIELNPEDITAPKKYTNTKANFEIIHVSNAINSNVKGHRTLIEAMKIVSTRGYNVTACCIGDGAMVPAFKEYARELGVYEKVQFIGRLDSRRDLLKRLSKSDLYVLPTYMEGLPRSIIEAQAVGLPCISTPVAGIPELLPSKYLFDPGNSEQFANEIIRLIEHPSELEEMSKNNVKVAEQYTKDKLNLRRTQFYDRLKTIAKVEGERGSGGMMR